MNDAIKDFRLPRYHEIPDVGLFLEQTVKYINSYLEPLGCMEITSSMISNYVKKGYINRPVKKQYNKEQIACLFFMAIAKNILTMENIHAMLKLQKDLYENEKAYNYFCDHFEDMLFYIFGLKEEGNTEIVDKEEKKMLRSLIIAAAHTIYLNSCLVKKEEDPQ